MQKKKQYLVPGGEYSAMGQVWNKLLVLQVVEVALGLGGGKQLIHSKRAGATTALGAVPIARRALIGW